MDFSGNVKLKRIIVFDIHAEKKLICQWSKFIPPTLLEENPNADGYVLLLCIR